MTGVERALEAHWSEILTSNRQAYFGAFPIILTTECDECGGEGEVPGSVSFSFETFPCPDCTDGRVPIEGITR